MDVARRAALPRLRAGRDHGEHVTSARWRPRRNLKDEVAIYIREQIFSGAFKPGEKIDQDGIALELGVSKLPVREALIGLEAEGLVTNLARRGAFVADLTPEDVLDHYAIFGLLAGLAYERASERITEEELAGLEEITSRMEATDDLHEQEDLNARFHRMIHQIGGSRRLKSVLRMLVQSIPRGFYEFTPGWSDQAMRDHRAILKALKERDGEGAARAAQEHLAAGGEAAVAMLRATGFWNGQEQAS